MQLGTACTHDGTEPCQQGQMESIFQRYWFSSNAVREPLCIRPELCSCLTYGPVGRNLAKVLDKGPSYGNSTTHLNKLLPRLDGGGGGGCPVLVFAISDRLYVDDQPAVERLSVAELNP
jgi:hypothetical protein